MSVEKQASGLFLSHHSPGLCGGGGHWAPFISAYCYPQNSASILCVSCSNTNDQVCVPALGKEEGEEESSLLPFEATTWKSFTSFPFM